MIGVVMLLALGDSFTSGVLPGVTAEQTWVSRIGAKNEGRSGEDVRSGLDRLPKLLARRPDVVLVMYGPHGLDLGAYTRNLELIIETLTEDGVRVVLMTPPYSDSQDRANAEPYVDQIRWTAQLLRVPLIDHFADWAGASDLTVDGVHPNPAGHERMARLIEYALAGEGSELQSKPLYERR